MRAPRKIYWVDVVPGGPGLRYNQRGGGKFTTLHGAQGRARDLAWRGVKTKIYESEEITWVEVISTQK